MCFVILPKDYCIEIFPYPVSLIDVPEAPNPFRRSVIVTMEVFQTTGEVKGIRVHMPRLLGSMYPVLSFPRTISLSFLGKVFGHSLGDQSTMYRNIINVC